MSTCFECVQYLPPLFQYCQDQQWSKAAQIFEAITLSENQADAQKMCFQQKLHQDLMLPVSKSSLLQLVRQQDQIANLARDISGVMIGRKITLPDVLNSLLINYLSLSVDACLVAHQTVKQLQSIIEGGFGEDLIQTVCERIATLNEKEHQSDLSQINLQQQCLAIEETLPPLQMMFLYQIIRDIGHLANDAQNIGDHLLILISN